MTNEQLKQEAIKKAYGEYWEQVKGFVDENGSCDYYKWFKVIGHKIDYMFSKDLRIRPKSLSGIDNNNKWLCIKEDGSNLPKESGDYWFYTIHKQVVLRSYNPRFGLHERYANTYSHYQPIVKPLPPIY
jgi:hypothetical protein